MYCVGLLGFNLDDKPVAGEEISSDYIHTVRLKDEKDEKDENGEIFYNKLCYIFVELPKFQKKEEEISTHFEKWLYFLKNLESFDQIPAILQEEIFVEAFQVAKVACYSSTQRGAYEKSLKYFRDNINVIVTARDEGMGAGIEEGRIAVAKKLLAKGFSVEDIAENAELSLITVRKLATEIDL